MPPLPRLRVLASGAAIAAGACAFAALAPGDLLWQSNLPGQSGPRLPSGSLLQSAKAEGTPGLMEFRWDSNKDFRRLYFFMTETIRMKRSEYYLILKPKDRKTAILKLAITVPSYWDGSFDAKQMKLCEMSQGGMMKRTRCEKQIPATIEVSPNGKAIEVFPDVPVSDKKTIGLYINTFNPFNTGMYQFNALIQAPGDVPVSGYVGSWLIQIDPN
jgi:hypothetical protein